MKYKKTDPNAPLEITINSRTLNAKFSGVLQQLDKFEPLLPDGIFTPAMGGDPVEELPGAS